MSEAKNEYPPAPGSAIQETMLRILVKRGQTQVAGYGRAKWLSAARALVRRGLAFTYRTGHYCPDEAGKQWVKDHPQNKALHVHPGREKRLA